MSIRTMRFDDGARAKLGLGAEWKWVRVFQCTAKGKKHLSYASTGFCKVTLRHEASGGEVTVILADSEWVDKPMPEGT